MTKQDKPAAKSAAERMRAMRARKKQDGLTELRLRAHPDDHPAIKQHAAELTAARMTPPAKKRRKAQGESNE